ncbi:MAG: type II secretion system F family protein [Gaiellales bacterium]
MKEALFDSAWGPVALALSVGCLTMLAALAALGRPRTAWIKGRLDVYGSSGSAVEPPRRLAQWRPDVENVYGLAERLLGESAFWARLARLSERANVSWRPSEIVAWSLGGAVAVGLVLAIAGGNVALVALGSLVALVAPTLFLQNRGARRMRAFDEQLADVLMTMAGALKVGQSFNAAMKAIVDDGEAPASEEFGRVLVETRLGRPMDEALLAMAERVGSDDLRFVLMSVTIQRQVGGSLGDLFHTVSDTVRQRQQFRRKVRALTAMGRASAHLLLALPFVTGGLISLVGHGYISPLFTTAVGQVMVVGMIIAMVFGWLVIRKIVDIKG